VWLEVVVEVELLLPVEDEAAVVLAVLEQVLD
jgi:hypothetical protein